MLLICNRNAHFSQVLLGYVESNDGITEDNIDGVRLSWLGDAPRNNDLGINIHTKDKEEGNDTVGVTFSISSERYMFQRGPTPMLFWSN